MDRFEVREILKRMPITEIPLRVTYYTRVSTDSDEQINSLENQIMYYENYIKSNPKWEYVPGYVDEGLTGITTKKRENFNEMIADAKLDKFDLIVTKEISRFARNTLDSLLNTRDLIAHNVGVYFQNDNINTLDGDGELRLTIMAAMAQDESRRLSSRVQFGHAQSIKRNVVHGNSLIYGYRKDNKRLVIDEEQAVMVRKIFDLYSTDEYSLKQLEGMLFDIGYRNNKGGRINHVVISHIIANPKYKGFYCGNKVKVIDMFTKKQQFIPQDQWRMFKDESGDIVPAIVDEDVWEKANAILERRSADVKGKKNLSNHGNLFTGKIFCLHCGTPFYKKST
jgi:DNA invertase Pin-like site-specific DNA recombinase